MNEYQQADDECECQFEYSVEYWVPLGGTPPPHSCLCILNIWHERKGTGWGRLRLRLRFYTPPLSLPPLPLDRNTERVAYVVAFLCTVKERERGEGEGEWVEEVELGRQTAHRHEAWMNQFEWGDWASLSIPDSECKKHCHTDSYFIIYKQ